MQTQITAARRSITVTGRNDRFPKLSESKAAAVWLAKVLSGMRIKGKVG
jgi:hypothetical protein